jgi:hypothetical protein
MKVKPDRKPHLTNKGPRMIAAHSFGGWIWHDILAPFAGYAGARE